MASKYRHGLKNKFYVGAILHEAGTAITWLEVKLVESVGNEDARDEAEVVNRDGDLKTYGGGKRGVAYTLPITWAPGDPACALIWTAYQTNTPIAMADMDGKISVNGTRGMFMDIQVLGAPKPSELNAYDKREFTFKPSADSSYEGREVVIGATTTTTA